jgi:hypothetical protein
MTPRNACYLGQAVDPRYEARDAEATAGITSRPAAYDSAALLRMLATEEWDTGIDTFNIRNGHHYTGSSQLDMSRTAHLQYGWKQFRRGGGPPHCCDEGCFAVQ